MSLNPPPNLRITRWSHAWPMAERIEIARGVITEQPSLQVRIDDSATGASA